MNFKNSKTYIYISALAFIMALASCSTNTKKEHAGEEIKEEVLQAKKELKAEYKDAIKAVDKKIAGLEAKLENATDEVKQSLTATLDELREQRQKLADEVAELSESSEASWEDIKSESEDVLVTYQAKIDSLTLEAEELFN